jgi:hypothetical protein
VVAVGGAAQPLSVQASQQLENAGSLVHAAPPAGAMQCSASRFVLHFVFPDELVRQHATKPGLPHGERAAHFFTAPLQYFGRSGGSAFARSFATPAAQLT